MHSKKSEGELHGPKGVDSRGWALLRALENVRPTIRFRLVCNCCDAGGLPVWFSGAVLWSGICWRTPGLRKTYASLKVAKLPQHPSSTFVFTFSDGIVVGLTRELSKGPPVDHNIPVVCDFSRPLRAVCFPNFSSRGIVATAARGFITQSRGGE